MTGEELEALVIADRALVLVRSVPSLGREATGKELAIAVGTRIHAHQAMILQLMLIGVQAEEVIVDRELGSDAVALGVLPCQVTHRHGIDGILLVVVKNLVGTTCTLVFLQHQVVVRGIDFGTVGQTLLTIDTHIGHDNLCFGQQSLIVLVIVGIGQREV